MGSRLAIVLAAGKGTRMKSDLPKVLTSARGRPMVEYVLDAIEAAEVPETLVVVGYRADLVRSTLSRRAGLTFVDQDRQLGTGHAVMCCRERLVGREGPVLILAGDSPLVRPASLRAMFAEFERRRPACLMGTVHKADPAGLGRVTRDAEGKFLAIVEEKDASPEELKITEVNVSCYVFDCRELLWALAQIRAENAQGEYYLTDCPGALRSSGKLVEALPLLESVESLSVNTPEELAIVEAALARIP